MTQPTKELTHWPNGNIEYEEYLVDNKLHRTNGPARIGYYEDGSIRCESYYIDGEWLTKEEFEAIDSKEPDDNVITILLDKGVHIVFWSFWAICILGIIINLLTL